MKQAQVAERVKLLNQPPYNLSREEAEELIVLKESQSVLHRALLKFLRALEQSEVQQFKHSVDTLAMLRKQGALQFIDKLVLELDKITEVIE